MIGLLCLPGYGSRLMNASTRGGGLLAGFLGGLLLILTLFLSRLGIVVCDVLHDVLRYATYNSEPRGFRYHSVVF